VTFPSPDWTSFFFLFCPFLEGFRPPLTFTPLEAWKFFFWGFFPPPFLLTHLIVQPYPFFSFPPGYLRSLLFPLFSGSAIVIGAPYYFSRDVVGFFFLLVPLFFLRQPQSFSPFSTCHQKFPRRSYDPPANIELPLFFLLWRASIFRPFRGNTFPPLRRKGLTMGCLWIALTTALCAFRIIFFLFPVWTPLSFSIFANQNMSHDSSVNDSYGLSP